MPTREIPTAPPHRVAADEAALRALPRSMIDAWNAGDGAAFAAPFFADDLEALDAGDRRVVEAQVSRLRAGERGNGAPTEPRH